MHTEEENHLLGCHDMYSSVCSSATPITELAHACVTTVHIYQTTQYDIPQNSYYTHSHRHENFTCHIRYPFFLEISPPPHPKQKAPAAHYISEPDQTLHCLLKCEHLSSECI